MDWVQNETFFDEGFEKPLGNTIAHLIGWNALRATKVHQP
jgi:hypothetical protein